MSFRPGHLSRGRGSDQPRQRRLNREEQIALDRAGRAAQPAPGIQARLSSQNISEQARRNLQEVANRQIESAREQARSPGGPRLSLNPSPLERANFSRLMLHELPPERAANLPGLTSDQRAYAGTEEYRNRHSQHLQDMYEMGQARQRAQEQHSRRIFNRALPYVGAVAGGLAAGPMGGAIGGGLGGGMQGRQTFRDAARGAAIGTTIGYGLQQMGFEAPSLSNLLPGAAPQAISPMAPSALVPEAGSSLGSRAMSGVGSQLGASAPSVSYTGQNFLRTLRSSIPSSAPATTATHSLPGAAISSVGGAGLAAPVLGHALSGRGRSPDLGQEEGASGLGGLLGTAARGVGNFITEHPLETALGVGSLAGILGGRERRGREQSLEELLNENPLPEDRARELEISGGPVRRSRVAPRRVRADIERFMSGEPREEMMTHYFEPESVNPPTEYYAKGGRIVGKSGGTADDFRTEIPKDSYVWDSTTVSLLGDGNTENGFEKVDEFENQVLGNGTLRNPKNRSNMKVWLSHGEKVSSPELLEKLGKGNVDKGAKILDKARNNLRKQKGVTKFLPPKSKSISGYLRKG